MCRDNIKPNVSFHLCLQGFYVLTVAYSNKTGFNFSLTLKVGPALAIEAFVFLKEWNVLNCNLRGISACFPWDASLERVAAGMNPLQ